VRLKKSLSNEEDDAEAAENVEVDEKEGGAIKVGVVVPQTWKSASRPDDDGTEEDPEEEKASEVFKPKNDYSLMDELMEFLEVPEECLENESRLEPILCGYFNKIMTALLTKQKGKTLEYLLLVQKGKIFDNLLCHMQHFSLASLMLHFLGMKFVLEDYTGYGNVAQQRTSLLDWDNNSDSPEEDKPTEASTQRSAANEAESLARFVEMSEIFDRKKMQIVRQLICQMSKSNPENIEKCLNAHTVLQDLVENENCFKLLVEEGHLQLILDTCC
jgi:hypothetical protein